MARLIAAGKASANLAPICEAVAELFSATKTQTPDDWGAKNRVYPAGSGKPGQRDPSITPYMLPFGRSFGDLRYQRIVQVCGAQMAKTETFLDVIGERLDNRPAPILYVGPSKEFNTDQFEPRLNELFEQSALHRKMVGGVAGKRQKKTLKRIAGVRLRLAHAGSQSALKSDPAALALVDEYDAMRADVQGQGDPLGLVEARGYTYADFQAGITSTPSKGLVEVERHSNSGNLEFWKMVSEPEEDFSGIWKLFQEGTREHWAVPCPHCGEYFIPRMKHLQYPKQATPAQAKRDAYLLCPAEDCGGVISDAHKPAMNAAGRYVAPGQSIDREGNVTGPLPDSTTRSRWVSGLMSPFVTIGERAEELVRATRSGDAEKIQTAVNAGFGELFVQDTGDLPDWEVLKNRAEPYSLGTVPLEAMLLTIGIDVQKNRLVYSVRGWGARATSWLVAFGELWGDTRHEEVWNDLDNLLATPIDGLLIKLAFVDSGFRPGKKWELPTNRVYDYARRHRNFVFATKGSSRPMITPLVKGKIEVKPTGEKSKYGLDLIRLDPNHWKSFVHERIGYPLDQPGAWHLPAGEADVPDSGVTEAYCRQIVAEALVSGAGGRKVWVERSRENHWLDAEALAAAAGHMLNVQHIKLGARRRTEATPAKASAPADAAAKPPSTTAQRMADLAAKLNR